VCTTGIAMPIFSISVCEGLV